ncbi:hypothetical protein CQ13_39675 [Bradyrhizobium retamae]|uniref:Uncharacterized protein n=1 Tax=Bradyrhizobium retamae TaxID=1300035 RepID=A0A0R3N7U3_9BRAD|nr:hypothetical protein CQ13_39675 [Bradyrhizobium retamae]
MLRSSRFLFNCNFGLLRPAWPYCHPGAVQDLSHYDATANWLFFARDVAFATAWRLLDKRRLCFRTEARAQAKANSASENRRAPTASITSGLAVACAVALTTMRIRQLHSLFEVGSNGAIAIANVGIIARNSDNGS